MKNEHSSAIDSDYSKYLKCFTCCLKKRCKRCAPGALEERVRDRETETERQRLYAPDVHGIKYLYL